MLIKGKVFRTVEGPEHCWIEEFDFPDLEADNLEHQTLAVNRIRGILERFNRQCQSEKEHRELLRTKVFGPSTKHRWEKTNLVTVRKKGRLVDLGRCTNCGATGTRVGIGGDFVPDRKNQHTCTKGE